MKRTCYVLFTLLLLAGAAAAQVCHAPIVTHAPVAHHQAAAVKVVVKEVITPVAVPILIPAYGAVYTPPVVPASPAPAQQAAVAPADLKAIADSLRAIDQRLRSLEGKPAAATPTPATPAQERPADPFNPGGTPQAQTAPPAGNALAIVQAKCAQCHSGTAEKGGGLVLVENGTLAKIPDRAGRKTLSTVYRGTMPPKSSGIAPLTDEEVSVLVAHYGQ